MSAKRLRKIPQNAINEYMTVYQVFGDRLSQAEYLTQIERINWEDGAFLRASSLFMLSQNCVHCERTLALALLCSSIESMTPKAKQIEFNTWLIKNKLDNLIMKNKQEIREVLLNARKEWLSQPNREGAFHNFKQFLLNYCPEEQKTPPIEDLKGKSITFEEALKAIYGEFRSLFLHEGLSHASYKISNKAIVTEVKQIKIVRGKIRYLLDLIKIVPWFSSVVKESLYNYLIKR